MCNKIDIHVVGKDSVLKPKHARSKRAHANSLLLYVVTMKPAVLLFVLVGCFAIATANPAVPDGYTCLTNSTALFATGQSVRILHMAGSRRCSRGLCVMW